MTSAAITTPTTIITTTGLYMARYLGGKFYRGEQYYLQIDSHSVTTITTTTIKINNTNNQ